MEEIENQVVEITYKQWQQINSYIKGLSIALFVVSFIFLVLFAWFMVAVITDYKETLSRIKELENKN